MGLFKKILVLGVVVALLAAAGTTYWASSPILLPGEPVREFAIEPGSSVNGAVNQIADAGVPVNSTLFLLLARLSGKSAKIKAGHYELKPGTSPLKLLDQLVRGQFAQESLAIIEGWTFRQMREAIAAHPALKHDTVQMSERELLEKVAPGYKLGEGLFFPDTYLFAKGASEIQIYRQAHAQLIKRLNKAWAARDAALPYKTPYEALVMASIVEKETGTEADRRMIAGVFVNRLKRGMLLQTDPTVIYGMGEKYNGNIRKRDLETDTPYNTYTRAGLPPSPIALPGAAALAAAVNPASTDALFFVSRGDGSSEFSSNLNDHNRAVNKYQR
ncbi:endolytic transglycosylase MltG [Janthinobacterium sp. 17J80-10]|uniref:endolytic transglycosylase MltG n=1 Tax=Janthinobacterium sp. 17J80-10 TaxID=2497863 RepID=UPI00100567FE|nr:endolytic transglycosylase MltG [Janthinobacterium sp. 17J80-10]QAU34592.1 endolytic transglycosylase MltG [Janthinobacterium sp. 17J80-10]